MSSASGRNGAVEALRFIGALAIVWFHLGLPFSSVALAALHGFILLQILYGAARPLPDQARRLLVPWLAWSAFYALASVVQALIQNRPIAEEFYPWMLLTGAALHLWYLPFSLAAVAVAKAAIGALAKPVLAVVCLGVGVAGLALANLTALPIPLEQYVSVVGAVMFGIWVAAGGRLWPASGVAMAICVALIAGVGWGSASLQTAVAVGCVSLALSVSLPARPALMQLSGLSLGIYVAHPAIYATLLMVSPLEASFAVFGLVCVGSIVVVSALKRLWPAVV